MVIILLEISLRQKGLGEPWSFSDFKILPQHLPCPALRGPAPCSWHQACWARTPPVLELLWDLPSSPHRCLSWSHVASEQHRVTCPRENFPSPRSPLRFLKSVAFGTATSPILVLNSPVILCKSVLSVSRGFFPLVYQLPAWLSSAQVPGRLLRRLADSSKNATWWKGWLTIKS